MTEEAGEVVRAVGAWVVVFRRGTLVLEGDADDGREGNNVGFGIGGSEAEQSSSHAQTDAGDTAVPLHAAQPEPGPYTTQPDTHPHPPPWRYNHALSLLTSIATIISHAHSSASEPWDGVLLAVGMPGGLVSSTATSTSTSIIADEAALATEWEDACFEAGFEYVDCGGVGAGGGRENGAGNGNGSGSGKGRRVDGIADEMGQRDEFGEVSGVARVRQALEACEWEDMELAAGVYDDEPSSSLGREGDADDDDLAWLDDAVDFTSFSRDVSLNISALSGRPLRSRAGAGAPLIQLSEANGEDADSGMELRKEQDPKAEEPETESAQDVEHLDVLLRKVLAVKEMSGHLSDAERKRMARRLVEEVMGGDGS